jgi:NCS2 family nucleobase:cation symporter-2
METGFAVTAFLTLILNLVLPEEIEDEETPEITANEVDERADEQEWNRIRKSKDFDAERGSSSVRAGGISSAPKAE